MHMHEAIRNVRRELGDPPQPFISSTLADGFTSLYDLPKQNIEACSLVVTVVNGSQTTVLNQDTDYTVDAETGYLDLTTPAPNGATVITQGNAFGMYTDEDLEDYIRMSVHEHCQGRFIKERIRTRGPGFIAFRESPMDLHNLPEFEEPLLIMLATINVLWSLANDMATDTNIQTAEGTVVDRLGRYQQVMTHIGELTERYERYCGQLNVGMFRTETLKLRRVSYTTGRLVPIFVDREYDDHTWPTRQTPPIDHPWTDDSGIPSPLWNGQGF
jgi:hypothetical protein